ncbi:MAG: MscL family protein [Candidatus Saccharimonas sp.]
MPRSDKAKNLAGTELKRIASYGSGFMNFIREQGVIGLAVGLAIGVAAGSTVKVIVDQLISPMVALLTRGVDLNSLSWVIVAKSGDKAQVAIGWGAILSSLITLIATAFVIYLAIHFAKLDRIDKKKDVA